MSFRARWGGVCGECDEWFDVGTEIRSAPSGNGYAHVDCPDILAPESKETLCPKCFTYHNGECL